MAHGYVKKNAYFVLRIDFKKIGPYPYSDCTVMENWPLGILVAWYQSLVSNNTENKNYFRITNQTILNTSEKSSCKVLPISPGST